MSEINDVYEANEFLEKKLRFAEQTMELRVREGVGGYVRGFVHGLTIVSTATIFWFFVFHV